MWARVPGALNPWILPFGPIDLQFVEVKITSTYWEPPNGDMRNFLYEP